MMLGVDIGALAGLGLPEHAVSLLHTLKITYPAVTTADEHVQAQYKLLGLPATYFINSAGQIVETLDRLAHQGQAGGVGRRADRRGAIAPQSRRLWLPYWPIPTFRDRIRGSCP